MSMLNELKNRTNLTTTENGAITHETSNSYVLDLFAQGSAIRNKNARNRQEVNESFDKQRIFSMFDKAYAEDKLLTLKVLFYMRDVRGGQGEREIFKLLLNHLAIKEPEVVRKNLSLIAEYGRYDDLYCLFDTSLKDDVLKLFKEQLEEDLKSEYPSLLAKWLKSENTSSITSRQLARETMKGLGLSPKRYRKTLSLLRKKLKIVERDLSSKNYDEIDYSKIPSKAAMQYRQAFLRNDEERYTEYLDKLKNGDKSVKVNAKTLYPYEIVNKVYESYWSTNEITKETKTLMDAMWKSLPDYINGSDLNGIAVVDTSGSMEGLPMEVAISLGIYLGERNVGPYKNHFITFSHKPKLQEIIGSDIYEKVNNLSKADWGGNTNIEAVFDLILDVAIKNNMKQDDIPNKVFIISDMEFDSCARSNNYKNDFWTNESFGIAEQKTLFQEITERYEKAGYKMPGLVFWNVNSRNNNIPMTMSDSGIQLVSGCSPSIFEALLQNQFLSAYDLMLKVINTTRYSAITI